MHINKFIESLEQNFQVFKTAYINSKHTEQQKELISKWYSQHSSGNPLDNMLSAVAENADEFKQTIRECLLTNHQGAIDYYRVCLKRMFNFMESEFPKTVNYYFLNIGKTSVITDLFDAVFETEESLTDQQSEQAIEMLFLETFLSLEDEFQFAYPLYEKHYKNEYQLNNESIPAENIMLDYGGENNQLIIDALYKVLINGYIEPISYKKFSTYFKAELPATKIRWLGKEVLLLILFVGKNIDVDRSGRRDLKIKVTNADPLTMICDIFAKPDGKAFNRTLLKKNLKNLESKNNHKSVEVRDLLIDIYKRFETEKN